MMAICTYSLHRCGAAELIDVVRNHQFALIRRKGVCELRESSEREQGEEMLRESEFKYRSLFKNMLDGFSYCKILLDENNRPTDFVYLEINQAFERLTGLKREDVVGKKVTEVIPGIKDSHPELFDIYGKVALTGKETEFDIYFEPLEIWLSISAYSPRKGYFVAVFDNVTKRKKTEEALRESEERLRNIFSSSPDAITVSDSEGNIIECNQATLDMHGFSSKQELIGKNAFGLIAQKDREKARESMKKTLEQGSVRNVEYVLLAKDGREFMGELSANVILNSFGNPMSFVAITKDITERKKMERQIRASLKEKELLLREIHHRVKNNLQVISSLLNLQSRYIKSKQALEMLKESQNRIKSMALVHEQLYQSRDLARIDFAEYIRRLAAHLFESYRVNPKAIILKINIDDVFLGIDKAIPCGLVINELVSNSLKHAFPADKKGEIRIDLTSDDDKKFTLIVSDNGIGFPKNLDFRNTESLGLQLVCTLADQLGGTLEFDGSGGTEFEIVFKEPI